MANRAVGILIMGLMVVVLMIVADLLSALLIIPLLIGSLLSGMSPEIVIVVSFVIAVIMAGVVFTLAGFRRK